MKELEQELWQQRPSCDERFQRRVSLFRAVDANDVGVVERLLKEDPSLVHERRRQDEDAPEGVRWGVTPLHLACYKGLLQIAELLIAAGADLEARSTGHGDRAAGGTPLHWAAGAKRLELVKLLASRGANLNPAQDPGLWGSEQNLWADRAIAEYLVAQGARVTIFTAVVLELTDTVRQLVQEDPSVLCARQGKGAEGMTPLHIAARENLPRMVGLLLACGAPRELADRFERTPIDVALLAGNRAAYEALSAHGSSPTATVLAQVHSIDRAEALRGVFERCVARAWYAHKQPEAGDDLAELERMLEADPSIAQARLPYFWPDNYVGATALHLAAAVGQQDVAELLLRNGASRDARDERYGGTPASWANEFKRFELAAFFEAWHGE